MHRLNKILLLIGLMMMFCNMSHAAFESRAAYRNFYDLKIEVMEIAEAIDLLKNSLLFNIIKLRNNYIKTAIASKHYTEPRVSGTMFTRAIIGLGVHILAVKVLMRILDDLIKSGGTSILLSIGYAAVVLLIAIIGAIVWADQTMSIFVFQPHEYINHLQNWYTCEKKDDKYTNVHEDAKTKEQIPFFYHCDPKWDPNLKRHLDENVASEKVLIGMTKGYMGGNKNFCPVSINDPTFNAKLPYHEQMKHLVGGIAINYTSVILKALRNGLVSLVTNFYKIVFDPGAVFRNGWNAVWGTFADESCALNGHTQTILPHDSLGDLPSPLTGTIENIRSGIKKVPVVGWAIAEVLDTIIQNILGFALQGYYAKEDGVLRVCAAGYSPYNPLPFKYGCTLVAPQGQERIKNQAIDDMLFKNRCRFLKGPRDDFAYLVESIPGSENTAQKPVLKFLKGEMHVASNIIGCIEDMLRKVFVSPPGQVSLFQNFQSNIKPIALSVFALYFCIIGFTLITAAQVPKMSDFIMYIVRLALVSFFAIGSGWYGSGATNHTGLYPALISSSQELVGFFLEAQNKNDPIGVCTQEYEGKNLLSARVISSDHGSHSTPGYNGVLITAWDMLDCKIINYLNFGTCAYTISDILTNLHPTILGIQILAQIIQSPGALLFSIIASLVYMFFMIMIVITYLHIFILSIITISVLVFASPLILLFALFNATRGIFQEWLKLLLGYILYPSFLFAFLALVFATFDAVLYGDLNIGETVAQRCHGVSSVFCYIAESRGWEPCPAVFNSSINHGLDFWGLLPNLITLCCFALLFYLFVGSVSVFMSALLQVLSFDMAIGADGIKGMGEKITGMLGSAGKKALSMASKTMKSNDK